MHFSKLRLTGFKSFVDPTDLVIADGLTGIVGPNGCGKSNLLEALRWVMGENRPTAMRGSGMEDVIFAGAVSRPARNFAEVSLSIDNSERTAPSGFNEHDQIEIVRRITRDVGSAFKANGKDARGRDVQMLFADASTGAHSPALVRQGQIAELISARPKARRRILEEAAGISGLYARRHEAELKLNAAETNLTRVDDVLEQLQSQIATLTRQARQAARYREIGEELRRSEGLLLYRRWREADAALEGARKDLTQLTAEAARAQSSVLEMARKREKCEEIMPPLREEEAISAAILQRILVERDSLAAGETRAREMIETLKARAVQLGADIERERALGVDAEETIKRLEWEKDALEKATLGYDETRGQAEETARAAGAELQEQETLLGQMTEDSARLGARHQAAYRLLDDGHATLVKNKESAIKAREAADVASAHLDDVNERYALALKAQETAEAAVGTAENELLAAEQARSNIQGNETDARAERAEAEGEAGALRAEEGALRRLVEREDTAENQVLDGIKVDKGYEAALGAALSEDLRAPVITCESASGWVDLPGAISDQVLPPEVDPLQTHVVAPAVLSRRLQQIGVVPREAGARLQEMLLPGQRLVSVEGDLWRWDGFRAGAEDAPSAAALRLQQINRLDDLTRALEAAERHAAVAIKNHDSLSRHLQTLSDVEKTCRAERRKADDQFANAARDVSRAEADKNLTAGRLDAAQQAVGRLDEEVLTNHEMMQEAEQTVAGLEDLDEARAAVDAVKIAVEAARITMMSRRSIADDIRREGDARTKRHQEITTELSGWKYRLATAGTRIGELKDRKIRTEADLSAAALAPEEIAAKRAQMANAIREAETRKSAATDKVSLAETAMRESIINERHAESHGADLRESRARADAVAEAAKAQANAAVERINEEQGVTPEALLEALGDDPDKMPSSEKIEIDVARLRRQREALGAVNLRAEEDAREIREEFDTLTGEKADLDGAIAKLRTGISSLNHEGRQRLVAAFEQVNSNFEMLFKHLFGGGEAKLVLVESDDPLEAGLEIMCQPPGKKLSTLSLLSGGEQSLTAMALIFAVFLANPAPICVLDEVDAPLDDANVTRLCDLLDEMARRTATRFMVITHHAVTMSRMNRLFGVTMVEKGVSQLVSVDLTRAEQLVA